MTASLEVEQATNASDVSVRSRRDLPRWVGVLSVLAAAAVLIKVQWGSAAPVFLADEVGNLGNALLFANPNTTWLLTGNAYMPGFSVLLTPIWWFTESPEVAYRAAVIIGAAVSLLVVVPLARIARHFGAPRYVSVVIGAIIVAAPSRALEANYIWAENFLVLLVCLTVALLLSLGTAPAPRMSHAVLLGFCAGGAFLAHGRALPFALLVLAGGVWLLRRHRRQAVAMLVTGVGMLALAYLSLGYIASELYIRDDRVGKALGALRDTTVSGWSSAAGSQLWYEIAAWLGMSIVGALVLITLARRRGRDSPEAVLAVSLVLLALAVPFLTSDLERAPFRLDLNLYGRYLDPFIVPLVACGLAAVWVGLSKRILRWSLIITVISSAVFVLLCVPGLPVGALVTPAHLAGVAHFIDPGLAGTQVPDNWPVIATITLASTICALLLTARPRILLALLGIWAVSVTLYSDSVVFDSYESTTREKPDELVAIESVGDDIALHADSQSTRGYVLGNWYTFWSTPRAYVYVDLNEDTEPVDLLLADLDAAWPLDQGGRPVAKTIVDGSAIWVFPGTAHDTLDEQNRVMQRRESSQ